MYKNKLHTKREIEVGIILISLPFILLGLLQLLILFLFSNFLVFLYYVAREFLFLNSLLGVWYISINCISMFYVSKFYSIILLKYFLVY